jgi:hypothetical protein
MGVLDDLILQPSFTEVYTTWDSEMQEKQNEERQPTDENPPLPVPPTSADSVELYQQISDLRNLSPEHLKALSEFLQHTNPVLVKLHFENSLRKFGAIFLMLFAFVDIAAACWLIYQGFSTAFVVGLFVLAALSVGMIGAIITGQSITLEGIAQILEKVESILEKSDKQ